VISGDIDDPDALRQTPFDVLRDEHYFRVYKRIEVSTGIRAESIDTKQREVRALRLADGSNVSFRYERLLLAMGAAPKSLAGVRVGSERVRFVKTMDDARTIRALLEKGKVESAAIVGAGFIGCEMAEAFRSMWGCEVTLIEAADQILPGMLDADLASVVQRELESNSVRVLLRSAVLGIEEGQGVTIRLPQESIEVDLVVVGIGVSPRTELALEAGIEVGSCGGIVVDERMRTNVPNVYAAGDCVECRSVVTGRAMLATLGSLANRQGRVAADHMAGKVSRFGPVARSAVVKVMDVHAAATGMTHGEAVRAGMRVCSVWGTFGDRAHYYPDEQRWFGRMVWERATSRLVGLQVVGRGDVTRSVDVFSSVLLRGGQVADLLDLEFAYAPPFASALDPLHHLAAMAMAHEQDGIEALGPEEPVIGTCVDLRSVNESKAAPSEEAAMHVPMQELWEREAELPEGDLSLLCERGPRSMDAVRGLVGKRAARVVYLAGGQGFRSKKL